MTFRRDPSCGDPSCPTCQLNRISHARITGEMAGALKAVLMLTDGDVVNKKGIEDILRRYEEEFGEVKK